MQSSLQSLVPVSSQIDLDDFDHPMLEHVYHSAEVLLSYNLLRWLAQYYQVDLPLTSGVLTDKLTVLCEGQSDLIEFGRVIIDIVQTMDTSVEIPIHFDDPGNDTYGDWLQDSLKFEDRKTLASNYTENAQSLLDQINLPGTIESVADHFCGSGNLIVSFLNSHHFDGDLAPSELRVRLNDLMPTAVLIAYCRILALGVDCEVTVTIKDGFTVEGEYDLILINPPYTRSHRISDRIKSNISSLKSKVSSYSTGRAGLHFWAVLGLEELLSEHGSALAVLPRAVLNARYSQALKDHILTQYMHIDIYEYKERKAFSRGSELKELIIHLRSDGGSEIRFYQVESSTYELTKLTSVVPEQMQNEWNWGIYFLDPTAVETGKQIQHELNLQTRVGIDATISRGIEMYGPNVFFFPNRNWDLNILDATVTVTNGDVSFTFPRTYVEYILRKPNLYKTSMQPEIEHVVLVVRDNLDATLSEIPDELRDFLFYIKPEATTARRRFGSDWYKHPALQLSRKDPRGHIFVIDKLDLGSTPTLAYYTEERLACTKNFYVLKLDRADKIQVKLFAAWLNSTLYFLLYLLHRREIGGSYGRMQIVDYDYHQLFPDLDKISMDTDLASDVIDIFDEIKSRDRGMLVDQIFRVDQMQLDKALVKMFDLDISVKHVHEQVDRLIRDRT